MTSHHMHMVHTGQCPSYLSDVVRPTATSNDRSGLSSGSTYQYIKLRLRTRLGNSTFSFSGHVSRNNSPNQLHSKDVNESRRVSKYFLKYKFSSTRISLSSIHIQRVNNCVSQLYESTTSSSHAHCTTVSWHFMHAGSVAVVTQCLLVLLMCVPIA